MKNVQYGSLFSQLLSLFDRNDFSRHVRDLEAEYGSKGFSKKGSAWRNGRNGSGETGQSA
jgi:hypothetical protein